MQVTHIPKHRIFGGRIGRRFYTLYIDRETIVQNRYEITSVLNHLGDAILNYKERFSDSLLEPLNAAVNAPVKIGRRLEPPVLRANARLLAAVDVLEEYLRAHGFSKRAVHSYPSLLRRFHELSGFAKCRFSSPWIGRRAPISPEWQELIQRLAESDPPKDCVSLFRRLAQWSTDRKIPPDPKVVLAKSEDYRAWLTEQPNRFKKPREAYNLTAYCLRKIPKIKSFPRFRLASRKKQKRGIGFNDWPTAIKREWNLLLKKWGLDTLKRGKHMGHLSEATIQSYKEFVSCLLGFIKREAI